LRPRAITEALTISGVHPETISYVEAHGTGTIVGDPIEVTAITQAYRQFTEKKGFCGIGSVKSNLGHLGEAAGVAAFIKTVLALENQEIPPSLHYELPNPQIDFANSPFFVNAKLSPWPKSAEPCRAGITSLGAGGTNCHVIVEEAPPPPPSSGSSRPWQLLLLSANTASTLETATANLATHLKEHPNLNLADVAYTLHSGRKAFAHRRALVCAAIRTKRWPPVRPSKASLRRPASPRTEPLHSSSLDRAPNIRTWDAASTIRNPCSVPRSIKARTC
jgi:acyl transferase domain-containing protein